MTLKEFSNLPIDWDITPEDAVTLYLEWGNNNWHAQHAPVRSKSDYAVYFVIDNWEFPPTLRLVRRNSEAAEDLISLPLPPALQEEFLNEFGGLKGIFTPTPAIKEWLKAQLYA